MYYGNRFWRNFRKRIVLKYAYKQCKLVLKNIAYLQLNEFKIISKYKLNKDKASASQITSQQEFDLQLTTRFVICKNLNRLFTANESSKSPHIFPPVFADITFIYSLARLPPMNLKSNVLIQCFQNKCQVQRDTFQGCQRYRGFSSEIQQRQSKFI